MYDFFIFYSTFKDIKREVKTMAWAIGQEKGLHLGKKENEKNINNKFFGKFKCNKGIWI